MQNGSWPILFYLENLGHHKQLFMWPQGSRHTSSSKIKEDKGTLHIMNSNALICMACSMETKFQNSDAFRLHGLRQGVQRYDNTMSSFEQLFPINPDLKKEWLQNSLDNN